MAGSVPISTWLVLGPIFDEAHQGDHQFPLDDHPPSASIISNINPNLIDPATLTGLLANAPRQGDSVLYGDRHFKERRYAWREASFRGIDWAKTEDIGDNIHRFLSTGPVPADPSGPLSFAGKHHALVFFLTYIHAPEKRQTGLFVRSDDAIRVWLNGVELESLAHIGERDIKGDAPETHTEVTLRKGCNILLAAVAETHIEWGFSARLENDSDLIITPHNPMDTGERTMADKEVATRTLLQATYTPLDTSELFSQTEAANSALESKKPSARKKAQKIEQTTDWSPLSAGVGFLHLERLTFTPVGTEVGELVYSLPMAPGEEVNIAHKEWSNRSEEFEKIVLDSLEEYSEEGVVETLELSNSTESQRKHSSAFDAGVTATGSYGPVTVTTSANYKASDSAQTSEKEAVKRSKEVTQKASSRVKKEHQITFKVASASGEEDQTVRKIVNPDMNNPKRFDYYQLMRKWKVSLYRYGVRLTYDLTIPEPGSDI